MPVSSFLLFPRQVTCVDGEGRGIVEEMLASCYAEKAKDPDGRLVSNEGGWQSNSFFQGETFEYLNAALSPIIRLGLAPGEMVDSSWALRMTDVWINISPPGAANRSHLHPMSIFSGVFYLQAPDGCGDIVFEDDGHRSTEVSLRTEANRQLTSQYQTYWIPPVEGRMILFPSTLLHRVERNRSDKDRVSVSFNVGI